MKITASYDDGIVKTSIPQISYDMSAKEYDAQLLSLVSAMVAACAEMIADGDDGIESLTVDAIASCARAMMGVEQHDKN